MQLDHTDLISQLDYNLETGVFTRKTGSNWQCAKGSVAGNINANGYRYISLRSKRYLAHRLAWFYVNGVWPENDIDHSDGNRDNNSFSNLREATRSQNLANTKHRGGDAPKGVHFMKNRGTWNAKIGNKHIGAFKTKEEAAEAYRVAATNKFGEFARF